MIMPMTIDFNEMEKRIEEMGDAMVSMDIKTSSGTQADRAHSLASIIASDAFLWNLVKHSPITYHNGGAKISVYLDDKHEDIIKVREHNIPKPQVWIFTKGDEV